MEEWQVLQCEPSGLYLLLQQGAGDMQCGHCTSTAGEPTASMGSMGKEMDNVCGGHIVRLGDAKGGSLN